MPRDGMVVPTQADFEAAAALRRLQLQIESRSGQDPQLFNELLEALDLGVRLAAGRINMGIRARVRQAEAAASDMQPFEPLRGTRFGETAARS